MTTSQEPEPICVSAPRMMIDEIALVRHQRRVQGMCHVPDHLEADEDRQHEDDEMLHEACRSDQPDPEQQRRTDHQQSDLIAGFRLEGRHLQRAFFLAGQLLGLVAFHGGDGLHFRRWRREGDGPRMRRGRAPDHVILHVVIDHPVLGRGQVGDHVPDIGGVKRAGLCRHPAGEIGVTDDGDAILGHEFFVRHGQVAVAAAFGRKVNDD